MDYEKIVKSLPKPETVEEQYLYGLVCTVAEQPNKYGAKERPFYRMEQYWKAFRDVTAARVLEPTIPSENTVSTDTIQVSAVTTDKIADNNITVQKLDSLVESRLLGDNRVNATMLQSKSVTPDKLAEDYTTEDEARTLISELGGDKNVIEVVKQNGVALPVVDKSVNVIVPDISGKQDKLIAGANITIVGNRISAVSGGESVAYDDTELREMIGEKQDKLSTTQLANLNKDHSMYLTQHQDISGKANVGDSYTKAESDSKYLTEHQSLVGYAKTSDMPTVPTVVSAFTNDVGYLTNHQSLDGYATEQWVENKGYITTHQSLNGYATESWVNNQGFLTEHQDMSNKQDKLSPQQLANINADHSKYLTEHQDISGKQDVISDLSTIRSNASLGATALQSVPVGYATEQWVENKGYLTEHQSLNGYATESFVTSKGYITSSALNGYATEDFVTSKGYLTEHQDISGKQDVITDLATIRSGASLGASALQSVPSGYATETWVDGKGYLTEHQDISGKVSKSGDTMSGALTFTGGSIIKVNNDNSYTTIMGATATDKGGQIVLSGVDVSVDGDKGTARLRARNQSGFADIIVSPNGTTYAPTPATTDNSTKIATTAFVNNYFKVHQISAKTSTITLGNYDAGFIAGFIQGVGSVFIAFTKDATNLKLMNLLTGTAWNNSNFTITLNGNALVLNNTVSSNASAIQVYVAGL